MRFDPIERAIALTIAGAFFIACGGVGIHALTYEPSAPPAMARFHLPSDTGWRQSEPVIHYHYETGRQ